MTGSWQRKYTLPHRALTQRQARCYESQVKVAAAATTCGLSACLLVGVSHSSRCSRNTTWELLTCCSATNTSTYTLLQARSVQSCAVCIIMGLLSLYYLAKIIASHKETTPTSSAAWAVQGTHWLHMTVTTRTQHRHYYPRSRSLPLFVCLPVSLSESAGHQPPDSLEAPDTSWQLVLQRYPQPCCAFVRFPSLY